MSLNTITDSIRRSVNETTTSSNIAYLPGGFAEVGAALKTLARMKKHWKINVVECGGKYCVRFGEGVLNIDVNKEHWKDFSENVLKKTSASYKEHFTLDLGEHLKEAKEEDISRAFDMFANELYGMLVREPVRNSGENIAAWNRLFHKVKNATPSNVLIAFETLRKDIEKTVDLVKTVYDDDRGMLELLASTIKQGRPLGTFEPFDNYEYLIGTRIESVKDKVRIAYETFIDMSFVPHEHIVCAEKSVLEELEGTKGIRVATNTIFPTGKHFTAQHFKIIRDAVEDSVTEGDGE